MTTPLKIENATEVTLLLTAATDYRISCRLAPR